MNPERVRRYLNSKVIRGIFRWVSEPEKDGEVKLEKILTHSGKGTRNFGRRLFSPGTRRSVRISLSVFDGKRIFVFGITPQLGRKCLEKNVEGVIVTSHYSVSDGELAQVVA